MQRHRRAARKERSRGKKRKGKKGTGLADEWDLGHSEGEGASACGHLMGRASSAARGRREWTAWRCGEDRAGRGAS